MNNWHFGNKDKSAELAAGGQGEVKRSQLTPEELEEIRKKYPAPTGTNAKKPIPIDGYIKNRKDDKI
ncbi:hypothetical protein [Paenibacillus sp. 22594]|uniref:hypothetical protein n=1 Tax=Paenibacillus sp. 22594 TaxID=3453947 RepID=UPI003F8465C4